MNQNHSEIIFSWENYVHDVPCMYCLFLKSLVCCYIWYMISFHMQIRLHVLVLNHLLEDIFKGCDSKGHFRLGGIVTDGQRNFYHVIML